MTLQQERMVEKARERDGAISYCGDKKSWSECFTEAGGQLILWFNDNAGNTHVIIEYTENWEEKGVVGLGAAGPHK